MDINLPATFRSNSAGQERNRNDLTQTNYDDDASPPPIAKAIEAPLLEVQDLRVHFPGRRSWPRSSWTSDQAVDGVSFSINRGETYGLVGEERLWKSILARAVLG